MKIIDKAIEEGYTKEYAIENLCPSNIGFAHYFNDCDNNKTCEECWTREVEESETR